MDSDGFAQLEVDNLSYVQEHRWPPLSYETAMDEYKRKYLDTEEEELGGWGLELLVQIAMFSVYKCKLNVSIDLVSLLL